MKDRKLKRITKNLKFEEKIIYLRRNLGYEIIRNKVFSLDDIEVMYHPLRNKYIIVYNDRISCNVSEDRVANLFFNLFAESYKNIQELFLNQLVGKKGILYFDMDQTIYDFTSGKENHKDFNLDTKWCTWQDEGHLFSYNKQDEEWDCRQGINLDVINYLKSLKDDYLIISNTSWHKSMIKEVKFMEDLFDFYGSGAGTCIESDEFGSFPLNGYFFMASPRYASRDLTDKIEDMLSERLDLQTFGKPAVNEFFYKAIKNSKFDVNDFKLVQFEDELTGATHITDFVNLTRGFRMNSIEEMINGLDTIYLGSSGEDKPYEERQKLARKKINESKSRYQSLGINFYSLPLGIHSDGAITWCKQNLK